MGIVGDVTVARVSTDTRSHVYLHFNAQQKLYSFSTFLRTSQDVSCQYWLVYKLLETIISRYVSQQCQSCY